MAVNRTKSEQFQLRLPPGLRDRIKAYADGKGRSMNEEIVRILEREYPEQWPIDARLDKLAEMVAVLKGGAADSRIDNFLHEFEETVNGILSGRVIGVNDDAREQISRFWKAYKEREAENEYEAVHDAVAELDYEEYQMYELTGSTQKLATPLPEKLNPLRDNVYLMDLLPPEILSEMTKRLRVGDLEGATKILGSLPKNDLLERINRDTLSIFEREKLNEASEGSKEHPQSAENDATDSSGGP